MLLTLPASAQRIFGWCEQGGARAVVNGNQSQNKVQQSFPACTVTVFNGGTVVPATIFSDAGLTTPLANPFTATSTGFWAFYASPATYDVQFSGTGITTPFTISGYTNSGGGGGGGGGGGSVGPGTVNNLSKFTSTTNVGNATCTDDGVTPMACGLGVNLSTSALFTVKVNNGSTGTLANHLVARDVSGNAIQAQPTDTNNVIGVAGFGAGTTGSVSIAYSGQFPCIFSNQTAIGDWVIKDPSSSRCLDAGASEPAGIENLGRINSINTGAGTLAGVDWGLPDSTNTSAGGGTGVVNNCNNIGALAYYPATGNTVGCPNGVTVDGSGNITGPSFVGSGAGAGFVAFQQGTAPTLGTPNANYLYADSTVTTTFGTALPSVPGTLNQVLGITSVPDATHIKLGFINGPASAFNAITSGTNTTAAMLVGTGASLGVTGSGTIVATSCPSCPTGGTPGGSNTQVQFNDSSSFGGDAGFVYNKTTDKAILGSMITKASPHIDPRAFGCVGDGTDTSSAATACWQSAVNQMYAVGGEVFCPAGTTWHLNRVQISNFTTIRGGGTTPVSGCIIIPAVDAAFVPLTPASYLGSVTITDMYFQGGVNPIDLPLINQSNFERLEFTDYTGCAMTFIDGEQRTIRDIASIHNGVNGFAVICSGDKSKSLFSASIPAPGFEYGFASSLVERIIDIGSTIGSGGVNNQWLWYGSAVVGGGSGGALAGGTFGVNALNLTCRWSCVAGFGQFYNTIDTIWDVMGFDNIGITLSPIPIGFNVQNQAINTWFNNFDFSTNTNQMTTEMFIGSMQGGGAVDSSFASSVDNSTTFGLKFGGGGYGQLIGDKGGVFCASGAGQKDQITFTGSQMSPNNCSGGVILAELTNSNVDVNMMADGFLTNADTALFRVRHAPGGSAALNTSFSAGPDSASLATGALTYKQKIFYANNNAPALIGGGGGVTSVQSNAFTSANTAGNAIIVDFAGGSGTADMTGCTDLAGNTYTIAIQHLTDDSVNVGAIAYATNIVAFTGNKVTCTASTNKTFFSIYAEEWSGIKTSSPVDVTAFVAPTGSVTAASSTITTTGPNELIFTGAGRNGSTGTVFVGSGYTSNDPAGNGLAVFQAEWRTTVTTGIKTFNTTWSTGAHVVLMAVAFKPATTQPGLFSPGIDNNVDLGSSAFRFRNLNLGGTVTALTYATSTNCAANGTAANPSVVSCSAAASGAFYCDVAASGGTCTVNTTAVTTNSSITITPSTADGTLLSKTCNTSPSAMPAILLAAKVNATSFTINMPTGVTNGFCFEYSMVN